MASGNAFYNFDTNLDETGETTNVKIPLTGIYYISSTVTIEMPNGRFRLALIVNDDRREENLGLVSEMNGLPTNNAASMGIAGFVKLFAGESISIEVEAESDTDGWIIQTFSSFTFHYIGRPGSAPAYLAQPAQDVPAATTGVIRDWKTTQSTQVFKSLSGMSIFRIFYRKRPYQLFDFFFTSFLFYARVAMGQYIFVTKTKNGKV